MTRSTQPDAETPAIRYVGTIPLPSGDRAPVCVSVHRHRCNPYCRAGTHAELLYSEDPDTLHPLTAQAIADLVFCGRPILEVRPAYEAPLPAGYAAAWLVTYGPVPAADVEAER